MSIERLSAASFTYTVAPQQNGARYIESFMFKK